MQVTNGTVGLLDRDTWRRENGRLDEGEWVGQWTICVQQSSGGPVDDSGLITFRLAVIVSRWVSNRTSNFETNIELRR